MIIDFHTHIFPDRIRSSREAYFPSETAFKLLYHSKKSKLAGAEELIESMDQQGVDKSVVFGFPWRSEDHFKLNNDYIIEAVSRHPDRLIGMACFDPFHLKGPSEAIRCLDAGLSGIGELAFYESDINVSAIRALTPVMEICLKRKAPILIHTNEPVGHVYPGKAPMSHAGIYRFLKAFPDNRIILAHWGGGLFFFNLLKKEVASVFKNVFFDTAASPFLYDPVIYKMAADIVGHEKILFGSDYPLIKPERYFNELSESGLGKEIIDDICGRNAEAVLAWP
jgi:uncharacterized protein